ncbi:hypothetical protein SANTM175S_02220 [Streptomyces antimycoticus]
MSPRPLPDPGWRADERFQQSAQPLALGRAHPGDSSAACAVVGRSRVRSKPICSGGGLTIRWPLPGRRGSARVRSPAVITTGGRERPQPGKRNVSITTPPPPPTPASDAKSPGLPGVRRVLSARHRGAPAAESAAGRRSAGAVALLSGCSDDAEPRRDAGGEAAVALLRSRGARDSTALLARYDATRTPIPTSASGWPRCGRRRPGTPRSSPPRTGPPPPPRPRRARPPRAGSGCRRCPEDEKQALSALAQAERHTADTRTAALATAPPELARLLASVAACGAAHVYLLTQRDTDS